MVALPNPSCRKAANTRSRGATSAVLAQRVWQAGAGLVTLACIAHFLTPVEQGYYYTFASLAAIQTILDMGLSIVLVQVAAHEFSGLAWGRHGELGGHAHGRFIALVQKSFRWYGAAGALFLLAYPAGLFFLSGATDGLGYDWRGAWLALVIATGVGFFCLPALSIIEGSGQVVEVYVVRLIQGVVGAFAIWIILSMGGGLYAVAMMPAMGAMVAVIWLMMRKSLFILQVIKANKASFVWREEVWPMQWRIGVSWICGYLLVQIHTPLLFRVQNPVVAGQMGLTMTVANMLGLLAMSWMTSHTPTLARTASEKDWFRLDQGFYKAFVFSTAAFVFGAAGFLMVRFSLDWTAYGARFLSPMETGGLLLAIMFSHISGLFAVYLRAHRREPFMWPSIIAASLAVLFAIWAAPKWGSTGIVTVLLAVNGLFGLPVAVYLWARLRQEWHAEA